MAEKIKLSGVPETMLQTVYARAKESTGRGVIQDKKALEIIDELDYDFSLADKDTAMRSGVIARTLVLDRLVGAWLAKNSGAVVVNIACGLGCVGFLTGTTWTCRRPWLFGKNCCRKAV
jgi:O-methyltransferase involved in polyketide biosynthesis